jgi:membrane protease YdiL (CAAX protease family)
MVVACYVGASLATVPVVFLLGNTMVSGAAGPNELFEAAMTDVITVGLLVWWLSVKHREWRAAIRLVPAKGRRIRDVAIGAGLGIAVLILATLASWVILDVLRAIAGGQKPSLPEQVRSDLSPVGMVVFFVTACIVAPVAEEFVFRGLMFRTIRDRHSFLLAAFLSALMFGAVHFVGANDWPSTVSLMATMVVTGFGLASIYEWRGNLLANVAAHSAFNLVAVVTVAFHAFR